MADTARDWLVAFYRRNGLSYPPEDVIASLQALVEKTAAYYGQPAVHDARAFLLAALHPGLEDTPAGIPNTLYALALAAKGRITELEAGIKMQERLKLGCEERERGHHEILEIQQARIAGLEAALDLPCLQPDACDSACRCCQRRWAKTRTP